MALPKNWECSGLPKIPTPGGRHFMDQTVRMASKMDDTTMAIFKGGGGGLGGIHNAVKSDRLPGPVGKRAKKWSSDSPTLWAASACQCTLHRVGHSAVTSKGGGYGHVPKINNNPGKNVPRTSPEGLNGSGGEALKPKAPKRAGSSE